MQSVLASSRCGDARCAGATSQQASGTVLMQIHSTRREYSDARKGMRCEDTSGEGTFDLDGEHFDCTEAYCNEADDDFSAAEMCCKCGGGLDELLPGLDIVSRQKSCSNKTEGDKCTVKFNHPATYLGKSSHGVNRWSMDKTYLRSICAYENNNTLACMRTDNLDKCKKEGDLCNFETIDNHLESGYKNVYTGRMYNYRACHCKKEGVCQTCMFFGWYWR